jgi:hypothetical protein
VNKHAAVLAQVSGQVHDLLQHRLERALRERVRYRYVSPTVLVEGDSYRIQSPCCSRKVDPSGGLIDIALLVPHQGNRWCLCSRDHAGNRWVARFQDETLDAVLDLLCVDSAHQFWP